MSPQEIRARIDMLECAQGVRECIEDVERVEFNPGESGLLDASVMCNSTRQTVTFVHGIPPAVLLAGLRAMERELAALTGVQLAEVA